MLANPIWINDKNDNLVSDVLLNDWNAQYWHSLDNMMDGLIFEGVLLVEDDRT